MNGVYLGLSLPLRMRATRLATRPNVWPEASTTYHLRAISPLGKYVDILQSPRCVKTAKEPLSSVALKAQRTSRRADAELPKNSQRFKNRPATPLLSTKQRHSNSLQLL